MDPVRLVTIEFSSNMRYCQNTEEISNELDELLRLDVSNQPIYEIPASIESNSAYLMNERRQTNFVHKIASSSVLPLEIDMVKEREMMNSSSKLRNKVSRQYSCKNERIISSNQLQRSKINYK
jgi:hypothetical protein